MASFRNRPAAGLTDNVLGGSPSRASWYGDAYVVPMGGSDWGLADEGSSFVATSATVGTGIAGHAAPVVADTDTKPLLHLFNGGSRHIVLSHLYLIVTAAGTAGTIHHTVIYTDNNGSTSRSSGGTASTPVSTRSDAPFTSGATIYFGAVVAAPTASRKVGSQMVREVIPVASDSILMVFGSPNKGERSSLTTAGTATAHVVQHFAPVVVAPGGNVGIAQIRASQSAAASYEFELAYFER